MKIFIAGATGAVGLPLVRALRTLGHQVTGMTRAGEGADRLRELGAEASTADAFDRKAVREAIAAAWATWETPKGSETARSAPAIGAAAMAYPTRRPASP